jgi:hypothetical protein
MRHISTQMLSTLNPLLGRIRNLDGLVEKKAGVFYRKSRAFLHFHEHESDIFADVRLDGVEFDRLICTTSAEQNKLVREIRRALAAPVAPRGGAKKR